MLGKYKATTLKSMTLPQNGFREYLVHRPIISLSIFSPIETCLVEPLSLVIGMIMPTVDANDVPFSYNIKEA